MTLAKAFIHRHCRFRSTFFPGLLSIAVDLLPSMKLALMSFGVSKTGSRSPLLKKVF